MTYHEDFTLPAKLLEQIQEQGLDVLPELIQVIINVAMQALPMPLKFFGRLVMLAGAGLRGLDFLQLSPACLVSSPLVPRTIQRLPARTQSPHPGDILTIAVSF